MNEPPIDWLRAAILERMAVLGVDRKELAECAHINYDVLRKYFMRSPWDWPEDIRQSVCDRLGLKPLRGVYGMPEE